MARPDVNFDYFLKQKYAQLQQQADATTLNSQTSAKLGAADAALTRLRTELLPGESAAAVGKTKAETNLIGEQAKVVAPESKARIGSLNAGATLDSTNAAAIRRRALTERPAILGGIRGTGGETSTYSGYSLEDFLR